MKTDKMRFSYPWVVKPSIGNPAIVSFEGTETTFDILLATLYEENLESLKNSLKDRIHLIRVGNENETYALSIGENIEQVFGAETIEEAIHKFESSQAPKSFGWHLISTGAFPPPLKFFLVTLGFKDDGNIPKFPQRESLLFTLQVDTHLKPNSIYLTNKDWKDFTFIHATDLHVAKRNDDIPKTIGLQRNSGYINFNEHVGELIPRANKMADEKGLDFIVITGDLIDYILTDYKKIQSNEDLKNLGFEETNWFTFYNILTGEDGRLGFRTPTFTLLGNHDYRLNPYNLDESGEMLKGFGLTKKQLQQYKNKREEVYIKFPEQLRVSLSGLLWYFRCINPDLDYKFSLGPHSFICLDTGPDEFNADDADLIIRKIKGISPSTESFTTKVLNHGLKYGLFLWTLPWSFLAGLFLGILSFGYLQILKFKLLSSISISFAVFLMTWIIIIPLIRTIKLGIRGKRSLLYDLTDLALALEAIAPGGGPDSAGIFLDRIDWIRDLMRDKKNDQGLLFVCMHTPPVNTSPDVKLAEVNETKQRNKLGGKYWIDKVSDGNLSIGSIYKNWAEFLDFLAGIMSEEATDLVLCGHAHQNIEFRIESYSSIGPARISKKKVGICTDVYTSYINNPGNRPNWWIWNASRPLTLVLQTTSLGPRGKDVTLKKGGEVIVERNVAGFRVIKVKDNVIIRIELERI